MVYREIVSGLIQELEACPEVRRMIQLYVLPFGLEAYEDYRR
jgi:hypothetical protein